MGWPGEQREMGMDAERDEILALRRSCATGAGGETAMARLTRRGFMGVAGGVIAGAWGGLTAAKAQVSAATLEAEERRRVEGAIPAEAFVRPRKRRRLLIFDLNVGYGGHASIRTANLAFTLMGRKTGAFETVVSRDPEVFRPESLVQFDAVFLNNTVGNLFEDAALRRSLVEFVYGGGGLLGVHGTTVAFTRWGNGGGDDWTEFGVMLGGRGANHRASDEHVFIKLDDPGHPLNHPFDGKGFEYRSEFFRVHEPYSRQRVRVLFSIDTDRTDMNRGPAYGKVVRADGDYALAWVRNYGRGRVFHCTIAHAPSVFWDPLMLRFYLAAVQFAVGDLPAPTTPSAKLTPAVRAHEKLGWRLGLGASTLREGTFFQAIEKAERLGVSYIGALGSQTLDKDIPRPLGPGLGQEDLKHIRLKLDGAGVRLLTCEVPQAPPDAAGWRAWFQFARGIGVEALVAQPKPDELDAIEKLCDEYDVCLAIRNGTRAACPHYWQPEGVLKVCRGRGKRVGACGDLGAWMRCGIEPIEAVGALKGRLIVVQPHDTHEPGPRGHDVPWGTGVGKIGKVLQEIHRLGIQPTMFGIEHPAGGSEWEAEAARCREFFDKAAIEMAK
jgi:type 1 glutamine amidotransferase/sugar phosphate isomerase/epimerase